MTFVYISRYIYNTSRRKCATGMSHGGHSQAPQVAGFFTEAFIPEESELLDCQTLIFIFTS